MPSEAKPDDLVGKHPDDVPEREPDEHCQAKRINEDADGNLIFVGYCQARAGKGTLHLQEGRCWLHED